MIIKQEFPHYIKYMGSKTKLLDFIIEAINDVFNGGGVCDLFAGSCSLSGAIRDQTTMYSNDIQQYSLVIADAYLNFWKNCDLPSSCTLLKRANDIVSINRSTTSDCIPYNKIKSLDDFNATERFAQQLINKKFDNNYHLFTKYYSGTWWSTEQCLWIDAIKQVSDEHEGQPYHSHIVACLLHAMAYCSQGTGHFAQYRDATTIYSMRDILVYRTRKIQDYFSNKYDSAITLTPDYGPINEHVITSLDYKERLRTLPQCTIYADPPYCFVHYSRFYHALETLVRYDYPKIQKRGSDVVKGRYREDRHQSPFCIRSKVEKAFHDLFTGAAETNSNLILSYSDTGMISLNQLATIMKIAMPNYDFSDKTINHKHMTMGRQGDRTRNVREKLLIAKKQ